MRTGIFGGTFNPPHLGHKKIAEEMKRAACFDRIIIIPTCQPPHKEGKELAPASDRINMCSLMFSEEYYSVSDIEIKRQGKSYTFDTLRELKALYPEDELYLIIGSDMLLSFHKWYRYEDILSMACLAVATRQEDVPLSELKKYAKDVLDKDSKKGEIIFADYEPFECSSTDVRQQLSLGLDVSMFLPKSVENYIKTGLLYDCPYLEYRKILREKLDGYRLIHSVNVAESAKILALEYGEDEEKAYFAGLVHDIMKNAGGEEQLQMMEKGGIILTVTEKNNPKLWHAMAGEAYLRTQLSIKDSDILNSVRYHTTGRANMSLLEKIIYVADYISAERDYPDVWKMRELALLHSLEEACIYSLQYTFKTLSGNKGIIHPDSLDFYNELVINERSQSNDRT